MGQDLGRLRSRLLVGAAAIALAAPASHRATAQEQPKWQPYLEAGGKVGTDRSLGDVDLFIPVWQDQTSMLFGDLRGRFDNQGTNEGNFGLGYRTQVDDQWILGGYGYFDVQGTDHDNTFYQVTLGLEALSVDWDFRANGYIPIDNQQSAPDEAKLKISGNTIQLRAGNETALYGFDGEVGWRVPVFPADGDIDLRAFVGGYYFTAQDADTVAGPRGRIEARLYDIDLLGLQSRLTVDGEIQWDNPRGTQAFGGLELRIPLGIVTGQDGPKLSPLDRRMVDRVQRDVDIVTQITRGSPEDVIVDGLTVKTHTIYFANGTGGGGGTQDSPTDIANAVSGAPAGSNAIIVADGGAGVIGVQNPLNLQAGQALLGGDSTVKLTGADSGQTVSFHVPGSHPTLSGGTTDANLIQMASGSQNRVSGLDLTGDFSNGIAGQDMERAIIIGNNIDGGDPGIGSGVYLGNFGGMASAFVDIRDNTISNMSEDGILIVNRFVDLSGGFSQTIRIADNSVIDAGRNGIEMYTGVYGASLAQSFGIAGNTVTGASEVGILLNAGNGRVDPVGSTHLVQSGAVYANTVREAGEDGIRSGLDLAGPGDDVTQALAIQANTITGVGLAGIRVSSQFYNVGLVSQTVTVDANTIGDFGVDGVNFATTAYARHLSAGASSTVVQAFGIDGNAIAGTGESSIAGIRVTNRFGDAEGNGPLLVSQQGEINGNAISDTGFAGIDVSTVGYGQPLQLSQTMLIAGNSLLAPGLTGILFDAEFENVVDVAQTFGISGNTVLGALGDGIHADTRLINSYYGGTTALRQTFAIDGNIVSGVGDAGIAVITHFFDTDGENGVTALSQAGQIIGNQVTDTGETGIEVHTRGDFASYGTTVDYHASGVLSQALVIDSNTVANVNRDPVQLFQVPGADAGSGGIIVDTRLYGVVTGSQGVTVDANTVSGVSYGGVDIGVDTRLRGGNLTQSIGIDSNTVPGGLDGIAVATFVNYASFGQTALSQALQIAANTATGAELNGIAVYNSVYNPGSASVLLSQAGVISNNLVSDSGEAGIEFINRVVAPRGALLEPGSANLTQSLQIVDNTVLDNAGDGINLQTYAFAGWYDASQAATVSQNLLIAGNTVVDSGFDGIFVGNIAGDDAEGGGGTVLFDQTLSIAANSVSGSRGEMWSGDGIQVGTYLSAVTGGSLSFSQSLVIDDNTVSGNAANGILVRDRAVSYYDSGGAIAFTQNVVIDPNTVVDNGRDGIAVATYFSGHGLDGATQSISIAGNQVSGSGGDGIYVGTFLTRTAASQTVVIAGNTVADSGTDGIGVTNDLDRADLTQALTISGNSILGSVENGIRIDNAIFTTYQNRYLSQTGVIVGNQISDSGINGVLISNGAFSEVDDATIGQTLAIVGNTIDGVTSAYVNATNSSIVTGGNAILVQNQVAYFATLNQVLTVSQNVMTNVALFDAIYVRTFVSGNGAQANQQLSIAGNFASANGGYGVAIRAVAARDGEISQAIGIVGNTLTDNFYGGIKLFASAEPGGTVTQTGSIAGNLLTGAGANFGEGIDGVAVAGGEDGVASQSIAVIGNVITGNAVGVYLRAGDRGALTSGSVTQTWTFTSNSISGNASHFTSGGVSLGGHGIYAVNSGSGSVQTISLASGNVITGNQQDGVRFVNHDGTQSATLQSNLGSGAVLNTITSNGTDFFASSNGGTQLISK